MDHKDEWERMLDWLVQHQRKMKLVGIGGNIRSFLNIYKVKSLTIEDFKLHCDHGVHVSPQNKKIFL